MIKKSLRDILPELESVKIDPRQSMKELGANSIDRADVVLQSMETLEVSFPLNELAGVENIQGLVDFLHDRIHVS
ncbi:MAG: phosphopantetheine-binding protein [Pseudanabaenales cyanobacterium]|nr:phosphopantetheine-binding protein [Pseudanabaenales cyanobacterium]